MTYKEKLEALLYRTENNIEFFLNNNKPNNALNEIGVMRGIFYAMEEITGSPKIPTVRELSYIQLGQDLKAIDDEHEEK